MYVVCLVYSHRFLCFLYCCIILSVLLWPVVCNRPPFMHVVCLVYSHRFLYFKSITFQITDLLLCMSSVLSTPIGFLCFLYCCIILSLLFWPVVCNWPPLMHVVCLVYSHRLYIFCLLYCCIILSVLFWPDLTGFYAFHIIDLLLCTLSLYGLFP